MYQAGRPQNWDFWIHQYLGHLPVFRRPDCPTTCLGRLTSSGTSQTTESLCRHEFGGGNAGKVLYHIGWHVRLASRPKLIEAGLGSKLDTYAGSVFMPDIKAEITKYINVCWLKSHSIPLELSEIEFLWSGGRDLDVGTVLMTVENFYKHYNVPGEINASINFTYATGVEVKCEVKISSAMFELRIKTIDQGQSTLPCNKHQRKNSTTMDSALPNAKHARGRQTTITHPSEFGPGPGGSCQALKTMQKTTSLTFTKLVCISDSKGGCNIVATNQALSGLLSNVSFASGVTNAVY
ncbi:hypothetical protein CPB83DRAFT_927599 [Crepidotus variabilis]|uniref:Uncharacterized protein n=1 Tax=Crepidotus variabilis TaxID=179855 RepID=A0A9P6BC74_9AGAR|nr:hypothetical protein CPB83DRAFT_927599 [Crepidotus variabilis]